MVGGGPRRHQKPSEKHNGKMVQTNARKNTTNTEYASPKGSVWRANNKCVSKLFDLATSGVAWELPKDV